MRKLRNTLYITQDDMYLYRDGETIVLEKDRVKVKQLPIHNLEGVVFLNHATVTPQVLELCSSHQVHVSYISHTGQYLVKIQNPTQGNVVLRRDQYRIADDKNHSLRIAQSFCIGKIFNSRVVLQRLLRDHHDKVPTREVENSISLLQNSIRKVTYTNTLFDLLGLEGDAAKNYYQVFDHLILSKDQGFVFSGRSRRPPKDEVNALLSYFYMLLAHEVESALETVGLDPQVGFYHQIRSGRSSLALDMMEELRPFIVDRFVVTMINNKEISKKDFFVQENGGYLIAQEAKSKLLQKWQIRKNDMIVHPYTKEKIEVGLIPYVQALLLARYVRGEMDAYPPFLMR
ncbi:type I-C CRISPR-associated endonuclease Cas1 [Proteiniclasticum sp. BAD-10]|uniref:CRISPR-associated endonuclease Cas1 n=1 Tax=Proteiniclasticum sediminis TaxID=2804028 RepID=A0A941HRZ8_9CLOT|nr:type I-C CRISPR-associated endonuclease Cas1c [Proteiniclasticum sediminis]MBR0577138.1 type I-C CRISPR-associated endonuclease Cas1 [Proteiniclasticum sediminis]